MTSRILGTLLITLSTWAMTAHAETPRLSVVVPHEDPVSGDHAEAASSNPSGLVFGEGFEFSYTYVSGNPQRLGEGHALMLSTSFGERYAMGLGYEKLNLPGKQDTLPSRWSWAHALKISPIFSIGVTWHSHSGAPLGVYDDLSTVSAGMQVRPWRWLAAGILGQNLNRPDVSDEPLDRNWIGGLSIRPGTDRVRLTGLAEYDEADGGLGYGGRLALRFKSGFSLIGRYDTREDQGDRLHQLMVGFTSSFGPNAGLFYYAPNVTDSEGQAGIAVNLRSGREAENKTDYSGRPTLVRVNIGDTSEYGVKGFFRPDATAPFLRLLTNLQRLSRHDDVDGVVLSFQTRNIGWAQANELRDAIKMLQKAGKTVYAWMPFGDTRTYAAASAADRILTTPAGGILLTGVVGGSMHVKGLLDKIGVNAEFVTTGAYKTFPELFTREAPSKESTEVQEAILSQLYGSVVKDIAEGRQKSEEDVRALIDDGPYTARRAKEAGLVDRVIHYDEFETLMKKQFGDRAELVGVDDILGGPDDAWGNTGKVAVIYIVGTITDGPSSHAPLFGSGTTGSATVVRAVEELRTDRSIDAVVVRVDSPGGSVTAADAIWRSLTRLAEKKPLFVSMGDVAASGGYYVAAPARKIFVSDNTITGSIGVFTGKYDLSGLYGKIGVNKVPVTKGARANLMGDSQPWSDADRAAVRRSMDGLYSIFLERVLSGRDALSLKTLKPLAGGRVWTGQQANANKLSDGSKGLLATIRAAAEAAGIDPMRVEVEVGPEIESGFNLPSTPLGHLLDRLGVGNQATQSPPLPPLMAGLNAIMQASILHFSSGTPLAMMPWIFP